MEQKTLLQLNFLFNRLGCGRTSHAMSHSEDTVNFEGKKASFPFGIESSFVTHNDDLSNTPEDSVDSMYYILTLLDLSKAFNSVNFDLLTHKLRNLHLSETAVSWFESYLRERQQCVVSGNRSSSWLNITSDRINYAIDKLNEDIDSIVTWTKKFHLNINPGKTQAIILGHKRQTDAVKHLDISPLNYLKKNVTILGRRKLKFYSAVHSISTSPLKSSSNACSIVHGMVILLEQQCSFGKTFSGGGKEYIFHNVLVSSRIKPAIDAFYNARSIVRHPPPTRYAKAPRSFTSVHIALVMSETILTIDTTGPS
ncbi:hypothetical protein ANN_01845 [Periplaneta americana]|uniref:Reverse transcriptase domain-containing protein n=1 Tax=Periplaneta americana TaxID=6978 RepID=A0ABQ8TX20_PERAM|nr:hypothetical protein ANN_01845 [Periplaneta americana]